MSLTLSKIDHGELCHGFTWEIANEDILAEHVARVALGQYRHVSKILAGAGVMGGSTSADHARAAIKLLTVPPNQNPWHRDGWVFQTISWIAAHHQTHHAITRPPHIIAAHKGFDGLQLELSGDGKSVSAVIVFEDKATDDARSTIRNEVWPGIAALEAGKRITELTHEVSALLDTQATLDTDLDVEAAISSILWKEARHYRVSITVGDTHNSVSGRARLFKGFDELAVGDIKRRRAETIYLPELRKWMDNFSKRVIAHIKAIAKNV